MKLLSTAVAICLALSYSAIIAEGAIPRCTQDGLLYEADRDTPLGNRIKMTNDPELQDFSVVELEFSKRSEALCDWEGLIEITLPPPATASGGQDRALGFEFTHVQSSNDMGSPSFHISSTIHSAEIFSEGRTLKLRKNGGPIISSETEFIALSHDTKTLVGHQIVKADNGAGRVEYYQDYLQPSTANDKVILGMNRFINQQSPPPPPGKGLCNVKVYAFTCST